MAHVQQEHHTVLPTTCLYSPATRRHRP